MLKTNMNYVKEKIYMVIIITKDTYYKNTYQVNTKNCSDLTYSSQRTFTKKIYLMFNFFEKLESKKKGFSNYNLHIPVLKYMVKMFLLLLLH